MSAAQAAIDACVTALEAVSWETAIGEPVLIDATPGRVWKIEERRASAILHLFGGASQFSLLNDAGVMVEQPTFYFSAMRTVGFDELGAVNQVNLATADALLLKAVQTIRDTIVSSVRFALVSLERLDRYDPDQMLKGEFLSTVRISLQDSLRV